ncbi:MAG: hypothetical protein PHU25_15485 [Deltaproteobacteria bacterium]|nr:hypothetical protein [Deltaproteobacteria bacterium]
MSHKTLAGILLVATALASGCNSGPAPQPSPAPAAPQAQPAPGQPGQPNAISGMLGALGQAMGAAGGKPGQPGQGTKLVGAQDLMSTLPVNVAGWTKAGEPTHASIEGMSSQAGCKLVQGAVTAQIEIVDTAFSPLLAMAFPMARMARVDSATQRSGPIDFGAAREYPGVQRYNKVGRDAEVTVLVKNRVLVTIKVTNTDREALAVQLASQVNLPRLAELVGG